MFKNYLLENHQERLRAILQDPDDNKYFSIYVDFIVLFESDPEKANNILYKPREYLPLCNESAIDAQKELAQPGELIKTKIRTRINGVPEDIEQAEIGNLVSINGVVVRISQPTVTIIAKHLLCSKCKFVTVIKLEWERGKFPDIRECQSCKKKTLHPENSVIEKECVDYQEIKIQDKCQINTTTSMTVAIQIILIEDLIDTCTSGDQVTVCGFVLRKLNNVSEGQRTLASTFLLANSLSVQCKVIQSNYSGDELEKIFKNFWAPYKENPLIGRDHILASICPQIYGMYYLKLALALILAEGVSKTNKSGARIRGHSHLLLCGDPGTGKSQMLRTASRLSARSVLTTGIGTTAAGLTAAAVKDSDGWHLEAGALVLSNGGVCCIDELTTMTTHDMASIHEAMEQQTISIAKAGLLSTLNCRCTVVAAINPVGGRFVDGEEVKLRLGGPLLSRFDLILYLKDIHDSTWDDLVSRHILQAAMEGDPMTDISSESMRNNTTTETSTILDSDKIDSVLRTDGLWNEKTLKEYFAHIHSLKPVMTIEAEKVLKAVFLFHRHRPDRQEERTTVRLMDSLVRLAEGHARLMRRQEVLVMDAIFAAHLINLTNGIGNDSFEFPNDPTISYKEGGVELLNLLDLDNMIESL